MLRWVGRLGLVTGGTAIGLVLATLLADRVVAHKALDVEMIAKVLYYQNADVPVHRVSDDPVLHYELVEGGRYEALGREGKYRSSVGVGGARGNTHPLDKADGVFRIAFFGGSTVYGHHVDDDETLPARLEAHLGEGFEVWNYGTSAYVQSQMMRKARLVLQEVPEVDLLVLMITNSGRRAFLHTEDPAVQARYVEMLDEDPYAWLENFPRPWIDGLTPEQATRLHYTLLKHSAIWRYVQAYELGQRRAHVTNKYAKALATVEREALHIEAAAAGVELVYAGYPGSAENPTRPPPGVEADQAVDLWLPGQPATFYEIHPPASVLDGHAARLAELLREAGWLPGSEAAP